MQLSFKDFDHFEHGGQVQTGGRQSAHKGRAQGATSSLVVYMLISYE